MYKKELERVTPESVGISSRKLLEMVKKLEKVTEMHGLMVVRHGKVILEGWWTPYDSSTAHICHSMGKSYVGTAVGLACTEGYLNVNDKIVDIFAEEIAEYGITPSENMKKLTIEHVLMMANGMSIHPASGEKLLWNYLSSNFDYEPGQRFLYNTTGSCMLGAAVTKKTGKGLREYLTEKVFNKIGLESDKLEWMRFHKNNIYAAPGVASSTENNLRLGMLYLQKGKWYDEQILDENWVMNATTRRIRTDVINKESHLDDGAGYGYQLWIRSEKDAFMFSGGHGQDVVLSRQNDMAISINQAANDGASRAENEILSKYLLTDPIEAESLPEDEEGYKELLAYMNSRRISNRKASESNDFSKWEGIYDVLEGDLHINTELRPLDDSNVYTDFYDHDEVSSKQISIAQKDGELEVIFDDWTYRARILATEDGSIKPVYTRGAIPIYTTTISSAYIDGDDLVIESKFLQTCFWSILRLTREPDGLITFSLLKERLHEDNPYIKFNGKLKRV